MKLHTDKALFNDAIRFTSQHLNLKPEYIEKDYWITYTLFTIFHSNLGQEVVFKGGTALSKCFNLIERFSEDIDLIVLRKEGETDNQLKTKLKTISSLVDKILPSVEIDGLTHKMGMNRKTAHTYNKEFKGNYGQVRDVIILESTWLGHHEPFTTKPIISFIGQMMLNMGQHQLAETHHLLSFNVSVLDPNRTLCEKIMSLVRFSYGNTPITSLKQKIRHTYDLHQLLSQSEFERFFQSKAFDIMLLKVAQDDFISFKNNNQWLHHHPNEALVFKDLEYIWNELKNTYTNDFKSLVYGELPNEKDVLNTLKMIKDRITHIKWVL
ncbi:nucleotidyl transferase AbiEii/AbiGii toxin family protein [Pelistega suis]|uniref:nucleotidyl transferase AbiEii/AbiGii toxin family protein n=1 Tax=Pelistega suis TaxID=1631957 RepID=UPI00211C3BF6|nr:nucleotidyl transferase AbiEii/AbiGii toxin family protein [Pelistega suis]MCQ9329259.1 nucleotidyl transferase AbiEii/AbiGii toxin family protein [Pelistega suis]